MSLVHVRDSVWCSGQSWFNSVDSVKPSQLSQQQPVNTGSDGLIPGAGCGVVRVAYRFRVKPSQQSQSVNSASRLGSTQSTRADSVNSAFRHKSFGNGLKMRFRYVKILLYNFI
ncbi:hypothetical protein Hdeb2414_s0011g00362831 [Helianthus debilis subsp. tardiflorus]